MALARVQAFSGTNTVFGSLVTTGAVTTTPGNMLVAIAEADTVVANGITVSDNKGNTWARVISTALAATFDLEVWVCKNITSGGASHTVSASDSGGGVDSLLIVEEWSGQDTTAPSDKSIGATGSSTALSSGASAATTQAAELVIGAGVVSGNVTMALGAGYTNLTRVNTTFSTLAFESKVVAATGAQTAAMTAGTAGSWVCQVATFKEAAAAAPSVYGGTLPMMGV